jgi:hypothetical protein
LSSAGFAEAKGCLNRISEKERQQNREAAPENENGSTSSRNVKRAHFRRALVLFSDKTTL